MPIFKPNEEALVIDDISVLKPYGATDLAGQRVTIVCKSWNEDIEGYDCEFTDRHGNQYTYFIPSDFLIPAPSRSESIKEPRWKRVANEWQKKLWKEKMEKDK